MSRMPSRTSQAWPSESIRQRDPRLRRDVPLQQTVESQHFRIDRCASIPHAVATTQRTHAAPRISGQVVRVEHEEQRIPSRFEPHPPRPRCLRSAILHCCAVERRVLRVRFPIAITLARGRRRRNASASEPLVEPTWHITSMPRSRSKARNSRRVLSGVTRARFRAKARRRPRWRHVQ